MIFQNTYTTECVNASYMFKIYIFKTFFFCRILTLVISLPVSPCDGTAFMTLLGCWIMYSQNWAFLVGKHLLGAR